MVRLLLRTSANSETRQRVKAMEHRVFFDKLCAIARQTAGINLKEGKEALVAARLAKRLRVLGMTSTRQYIRLLESDTTGEELQHYIDSIATNFTSFFREHDHFEVLQDRLIQWHRMGQTRFRFWSAACSTGEEPYTMAMALREVIPSDAAIDWKILATDISGKALSKAIAGQYERKSVNQVPNAMRAAYFQAIPGPRGVRFEILPEMRSKVTFARLNLSKPPFPMRGPLDAIFCRNVMIYFNGEVRQNLVWEMERLLKRGGVLFTGHSESLTTLSTTLRSVGSSVYVKP